ncbi:MAG: hypothetical protein V7K77_17935, partial [Nostoc sp.]|uniref:hypothetical protein n=1 Tax=Nostoc sp. TaxID=1180 RepID=UPI002FF5B5DE
MNKPTDSDKSPFVITSPTVQQPMSSNSSNQSEQSEQVEKIYLPRTSESENLKKIRHTASHVMA